jgi:ribonuclease HII
MKLHPSWQAEGLEAGCDEAGRGCLAGPVTAAAVIWHDVPTDLSLRDSKKLPPRQRESWAARIQAEASAWAVAHVSPAGIDQLNILHASFTAMHQALDKLSLRPQQLLIDGNRFRPYQDLPHQCFVGGDDRFVAIAAASILAKVHRDRFMRQLHERYPAYAWKSNKGYPTKYHREALNQVGPSPWHRRSFLLKSKQAYLDFK